MREILFRGAQKVDGSKSLYWHEGSLVIEKDDYTGEVEYYIQNESGSFLVIPETVGQYTGLTDKNGTMIFEGDILKYINDDNETRYLKVVFEECAFLINDSGITEYDLLPTFFCLGIEVAGNIHENPELLKETEQE